MAKLKITNATREQAFIKYKGLKDGLGTLVDLRDSIAPTRSFVSPIDVPPGSEVTVRVHNLDMRAKVNTNKVLVVQGRVQLTLEYR